MRLETNEASASCLTRLASPDDKGLSVWKSARKTRRSLCLGIARSRLAGLFSRVLHLVLRLAPRFSESGAFPFVKPIAATGPR